MMEASNSRSLQASAAEAAVRDQVRLDIGDAMTSAALREAMRRHTFDSYRQDVFKDGASALAIVARLA